MTIPIFRGYKIYLSSCQIGMGGGTAVLFWRSFDLNIRTTFLNSEGKLVVLDVNSSDRVALRLPLGCLCSDRTTRIFQTSGGFPRNVSIFSVSGQLK